MKKTLLQLVVHETHPFLVTRSCGVPTRSVRTVSDKVALGMTLQCETLSHACTVELGRETRKISSTIDVRAMLLERQLSKDHAVIGTLA